MGPLVWKNSYSFKRFFWFYIQRKFIYTNLNFSSCMRMISNHDFYFIVVNRFFFFWTAENRLYRNHQMKLIIIDLSKSKENQNTVEKNEFYEWRIWRTIMKTMNENNFICIKINSWLSTKNFASISFYHRFRTDQFFQQLIFFSDLIRSDQIKRRFRQHFFLSSISYRSTFQ